MRRIQLRWFEDCRGIPETGVDSRRRGGKEIVSEAVSGRSAELEARCLPVARHGVTRGVLHEMGQAPSAWWLLEIARSDEHLHRDNGGNMALDNQDSQSIGERVRRVPDQVPWRIDDTPCQRLRAEPVGGEQEPRDDAETAATGAQLA